MGMTLKELLTKGEGTLLSLIHICSGLGWLVVGSL